MASGWWTKMDLCQTGKGPQKTEPQTRERRVGVMHRGSTTYRTWARGKLRRPETGTEFDVKHRRASKGVSDNPPPDAQETGEMGHKERRAAVQPRPFTASERPATPRGRSPQSNDKGGRRQTGVMRPGSRYVWKFAILSPRCLSTRPAPSCGPLAKSQKACRPLGRHE